MVHLRAFSPPTENIELQLADTEAHIHSGSLGSGTLYIAHSALVWLNVQGEGFTLEYPAISLHAVSKDTSSFPKPCLYVMLDAALGKLAGPKHLPGEFEDERDDKEDDDVQDESATVREVRFVPQDPNILDGMYSAMSQCQMLHPDPEDSFSDEGEELEGEEGYYESLDEGSLQNGQFFTDASGVDQLNAQGRATLNRLMTAMEIGDSGVEDEEPTPGGAAVNGAAGDAAQDDQFEDAPDMDQ